MGMGVAASNKIDKLPLVKKYNVKCVPTLIVLTKDGKVITD